MTCFHGIGPLSATTISHNKSGTGIALGLLSSVFFTWGFLTSLNSLLIPHLQQVFELSYTQSMMIQGVFSSAPLLVSLPTARLMTSIGYKKTLILGLTLVIAGALAFYPATAAFSFPMVLCAVLITALGVAALQVVANPYVAELGKSETASARLTMTSGINSLGTTVAPYLGAIILFSATSLDAQAKAELVQGPYLATAAAVLVLAIMIRMLPMPEPRAVQTQQSEPAIPAWKFRHLIFGVAAIFAYCGAEVSIGNFLMSYLIKPELGGFDMTTAGKLVALYWGGAMVGRLSGSLLFRFVNARKVLIFNAVMAALLVAFAVINPGRYGAYALLAVGLFNSIMYPVLFSLSLNKLGSSTAQASGLLIMAGLGGGVVPMIQAMIADNSGLLLSLITPAVCYSIILGYGLVGWKPALFGSKQSLTSNVEAAT